MYVYVQIGHSDKVICNISALLGTSETEEEHDRNELLVDHLVK